MPYVQRDGSGNITGVYANPQPGYATEFLAAADPTVIAYLAPKPPPPDPVAILQKALLAKAVITQADLTAAAATVSATPAL